MHQKLAFQFFFPAIFPHFRLLHKAEELPTSLCNLHTPLSIPASHCRNQHSTYFRRNNKNKSRVRHGNSADLHLTLCCRVIFYRRHLVVEMKAQGHAWFLHTVRADPFVNRPQAAPSARYREHVGWALTSRRGNARRSALITRCPPSKCLSKAQRSLVTPSPPPRRSATHTHKHTPSA